MFLAEGTAGTSLGDGTGCGMSRNGENNVTVIRRESHQ